MKQYTVFLNAIKYLRLIEEVQLSVIVDDTWLLQVTFRPYILSLDASQKFHSDQTSFARKGIKHLIKFAASSFSKKLSRGIASP